MYSTNEKNLKLYKNKKEILKEIEDFISFWKSKESKDVTYLLFESSKVHICNDGFIIYSGNLKIHFTDLKELPTFFTYFKKIKGDLDLYCNRNLENISALKNLEEIGGNFRIYDSKNLKSLEGISKYLSVYSLSLEHIGITEISNSFINVKSLNKLSISHCENLKTIKAFKNIERVGTFDIRNCNNLEYIEPFKKLKNIWKLYFVDILKIENMGWLQNIKNVEKHFSVNFENLKSFKGLENLEIDINNFYPSKKREEFIEFQKFYKRELNFLESIEQALKQT